MKILIRPGLILAVGLLAIGGGVTVVNWRLARDAARDRADYFEERVLGQTERAKSLAERHTDLLARYAVLQDELTTVRQNYASEHAAHEPLRRQIETLIGDQIKHQAAMSNRERQFRTSRARIEQLNEQVAALQQAAAAGSSTNANLLAANTALQAELAAAGAELAKAVAARDGALQRANALTEESAALRGELTAWQGKHAAREQELLAARQRLDALTAELQTLQQSSHAGPPARDGN
jgi:chromosome segregation ATPase